MRAEQHAHFFASHSLAERCASEAIAPRRAFFGVFDDGLSPVELEAEIERVRKAQGMTENDEALIVRWEPEQ